MIGRTGEPPHRAHSRDVRRDVNIQDVPSTSDDEFNGNRSLDLSFPCFTG